MFQRFQILIKSEKNLSVFVYGKSRTNKVNNNYNNIVLFRPYYIGHIIFPILLADTEIQSNSRHPRFNLEGGFDG